MKESYSVAQKDPRTKAKSLGWAENWGVCVCVYVCPYKQFIKTRHVKSMTVWCMYENGTWREKKKKVEESLSSFPILTPKVSCFSCFLLLFSSETSGSPLHRNHQLRPGRVPLPRLNQKVLCSCPLRTQKAFSKSSIIINSNQNLETTIVWQRLKKAHLRIGACLRWDSRKKFPIHIATDLHKNLWASALS